MRGRSAHPINSYHYTRYKTAKLVELIYVRADFKSALTKNKLIS